MRRVKTLAAALLIAASALSVSAQRSEAAALLKYAGPAAAGKFAPGSLIGVVSFLAVYDIIRRTSCSGDFLRLGGPGFGEPIRPTDNVLVPRRCVNGR
ncbi:MAG: hypothetical protein ACRCVA_22900 [Phreatobacter sp.]